MSMDYIQILTKELKKAQEPQEDDIWLTVITRRKSDFNTGSLRLVQIDDKGKINASIGLLKAKNKLKVDVYFVKFKKSDFTAKEAQEWVANKYVQKIFN